MTHTGAMPAGIQRNVALAPHTTLRIGGPAAYFAEITKVEQLSAVAAWADAQSVPVHILGGGSNVLVADAGVPGLVMHMATSGVVVKEETVDTIVVTAAAGESWDAFVAYTVEQGWWGLENLSAIPGSVGAAPVQNIGAYGVEVADCIEAVTVFDIRTGASEKYSVADCGFAYRQSVFKTDPYLIITDVTFRLRATPQLQLHYRDLAEHFTATDPSAITQAAIREAVVVIRGRKFPSLKEYGTAGSFFKNPTIAPAVFKKLKTRYREIPGYETAAGIKVPAGWLIDQVLEKKGYTEGAIGTHSAQALVLVTTEGATAEAVTHFASVIQAEIKVATGIELEWEVTRMP